MNSERLAYLAGAIDSDGSIAINRAFVHSDQVRKANPYYVSSVRLNQIHPQIPQLFFETFGGLHHVYHYKSRSRSKPLYTWQVTNQKAATVALVLLPHLILKKRHAELVIQFQESVSRTKGRRLPPVEKQIRKTLWKKISRLNDPRGTKSRGQRQ